jgi:hypothetical protein
MARGDSVHGIGIVGDLDASLGQLVPESYRPGAGDRRRSFQSGQTLGELFGPADKRLPDPLAAIAVERGEDLAPEAVENGEPLALGAGLADSAANGVEAADPGRGQAGGGAQAAGRGDADPQAGEGTGPEPDGEKVDGIPAAGDRRRPLDLLEQGGRVSRLALRGKAQPRLV